MRTDKADALHGLEVLKSLRSVSIYLYAESGLADADILAGWARSLRLKFIFPVVFAFQPSKITSARLGFDELPDESDPSAGLQLSLPSSLQRLCLDFSESDKVSFPPVPFE